MESEYLIQRRNRLLGISPVTEKKKGKPIQKKSQKMKGELKEYKKIVKEMLAENNKCELKTPVCSVIATGLHHMKRRGVSLLDRKYLKRACDGCNFFVETDPQYALDHGLSISVHKI